MGEERYIIVIADSTLRLLYTWAMGCVVPCRNTFPISTRVERPVKSFTAKRMGILFMYRISPSPTIHEMAQDEMDEMK